MSIDFIIILEYNLRADPSRTIKEIWKPKEERFGKIYDKEKGKNQSIFNEKLSSKYADFLNMCLENRIFKIEKVATTLLDFEKTMPNQ